MATVNPRSLFEKLNGTSKRALEGAAGLCLSRTHFHVELEHWLLKLLDGTGNDLVAVFKQYDVDAAKVRQQLEAAAGRFKTGNGRAPDLSPDVLDAVREAWVLASLEYGATRVRTAHVLAALLTDRSLSARTTTAVPELAKIGGERLQRELKDLLPRFASEENEQEAAAPAAAGPDGHPAPTGSSKTPSLDQFTVNMTANARAGQIDPVVGRDAEIRQVIDILTRRRQNNPILTGEAGVGKTAVVEGLALRIAAGDVPPPLKNVDLRSLDLGLLQAGAGVKGEFENRLKAVIQEVKSSPTPVILFIDEAHTMIGAGGAAGQNDAANLLKPPLARGELRTIAATTFAEYKKFFETDAALKRRFQLVRVEEPGEANAVRMLRGLLPVLEKHHKVRVMDDAVTETVRLSVRYMPDRQLPDKAVSLLDTVCGRVSLSQLATPPALEDSRREIEYLANEIAFLEREGRVSGGNPERLADLKARRTAAEARTAELEKQLAAEQKVVTQLHAVRDKIEAVADPAAVDPAAAAELASLTADLAKIQGESPLVYPVVAGQAVAEVVARLTGVPIGKMVRNEIETLRNLPAHMRDRVVGQDHAMEAIAERIRTARTDLSDPRRPVGVFLLVGPSGVGKTETAMALADLLYGGDRNMVVVNMSEYKEAHKVSRLTGSAKGYVGYGEGGVLTNAVKNRPYSVVLLDEVEKADESVQEIFYQVFDKGVLQNDTGEDVNFKNTIILLTSNAGTDTIMKACADPETTPDAKGLAEVLRPDLLKWFKPALLGRMVVVPYFPLREDVLKRIIELQLKKIGDRLRFNHKAAFAYDPVVVDTIAARCTEVESGARNVDHIITGTVLPAIADEILARMADGKSIASVKVGVAAGGTFTFAIE
ncbi:type VI secretion system ATPase TssH [Gemmata sp.]|uniref:type VI secretion system ATPase TssH n=1 Tax=Gemmata sp. TaxID=1914242 RepID=UPI003F6FCDFE